MGNQVNTGLTDNGSGRGVTTHYAITYDDSLATADGKDRANALMAVCEADYGWMDGIFGGGGIPFTLPVSVQLNIGGYAGAGWGPPIGVTPGNGQPLDLVRYLLVSEVVEMMMMQRANGWGYSFGDGNEGSKGEALSRYLGFKFLADNGLSTGVLTSGGSTFFVSNSWLNGTRDDFVNNNPDDNHPDNVTGCTTLFLYYLIDQLKFTLSAVIAAGAETLGDVYTNLTGDAGDPFPFFKGLLDHAFPGTNTITTGTNQDNPYPLGMLSFWVDKSTFGKDEIADLISNASIPVALRGLVQNAFWVVLEGFSIDAFNALGITVPVPTGAFASLSGVHIQASPGGPVFEDPSNTRAPQRIRFSFDVKFTSTSAFPNVGDPPVLAELDATATVGGQPLTGATASTVFELFGGEDPYFTNIDPTGSNTEFYLSQDLRVFSIKAGDQPVAGAPAFTSDPYASIQSLLHHLNTTSGFTAPSSTDPLNGLPGQSGYETGDSSVAPVDAGGHQLYNFAIARVRLRGSALASAPKVRVFFRLFVAQSCDTDFAPTTTYKSTLGTSGADNNHPIFPLASDAGLSDPNGNSLRTQPFFATGAGGAGDYDGSNPDANVRDLQIPSGADAVWAYFGCFLDVYDASNNATFGGTHHCIVAEIAYDDAPIPATTPSGTVPSPANWDKLAQRNLQITLSENPKARATHVIPQAFDLRPSKTLAPLPGSPVNLPDELMIDWGRTPVGSTALIYWPGLQAADVVALASTRYATHLLTTADPHTLACTTTKGATYVPLPVGSGANLAGLFTIDLPATVREKQQFDIAVRRLTTRRSRFAKPTPVPVQGAPKLAVRARTPHPAEPGATPVRTIKVDAAPAATQGEQRIVAGWRQVAGAFQIRIPVTNRTVMLRPEENTLAVLRWRLEHMPRANRWYPVLERYVALVAARVDGLGGDSEQIKPSLQGFVPGHVKVPTPHRHHAVVGKICAVAYDRFGDFIGFELETEDGRLRPFRAQEAEVAVIVRRAWQERYVVRVLTEADGNTVEGIVLLRAPLQR
jgi:hypothetical protein